MVTAHTSSFARLKRKRDKKIPFKRKEGDIIAKRKFVRARTAEGRRKQIAAIRRNYAKSTSKLKNIQKTVDIKKASKVDNVPGGEKTVLEDTNKFPSEFPFWARLKISTNRTTLVIDEEKNIDKKTGHEVDMFVHREATHTYKKEFEEINPNPDSNDHNPMYLRRPTKLPKKMFTPHNKQLSMPEHLKEKYSKNNKK